MIAALTTDAGRCGAVVLLFSVVGLIYVARHWPPRRTPGRTALSVLLDGLPPQQPPPYAGFGPMPFGLNDGESGEYRYCPEEMRTRYSAVRADGSCRCWTCNAETPAGDHL
jgi:hypothetical protein